MLRMFASLVLITMATFAAVGEGAVFSYDPQDSERPNELDANWLMGGTTDPIWNFYSNGEVAGINVSGGDKGFWQYLNSGLSDSGYTVDFRVVADSDPSPTASPVCIAIADSGELVLIRVDPTDGVRVVQEGGATWTTTDVAPGHEYHTYRYVREGQDFVIYMDDGTEPVLTGVLANNGAVGTLDRMLFGKADSLCNGTWALDYLVWDTSGAEYRYIAEDLSEDFEIGVADVSGLASGWLDCTDPWPACSYNNNESPGRIELFRDMFEVGDDLDPNVWTVWDDRPENVSIVDGKLVLSGGPNSGTWDGWNELGVASITSFVNPIAEAGNDDVLYLYMWNVTPRVFPSDDRSRAHALGLGNAGESDYFTDKAARDRSGWIWIRRDHPLGGDNITDGEAWMYSRVAQISGGVMANDGPGDPHDFSNEALDLRVIMDGGTGEAIAEYKPAGTGTWMTEASPLTSGTDDFGVERIDDTPLHVNFNGVFMYIEIDEVYVAYNDDRTMPAPICGDEGHPLPFGDVNGDCYVNLADFAQVASLWQLNYDPRSGN